MATVYDELDAIGINYNLNLYDGIHEKYPEKCVFSSECCATGTTRGWYDDDCHEKGYLSAYDKDTNNWFLGRERTWKFLNERPWVLGGYQWIAFEHRGEAVWPRLCSQSGAIDLYLQKKDAFYQNQSLWLDTPMVHLLPHWNFSGREGEPIRVSAYTNCDMLELFLNGRSLGRKEIEKFGHGEWQVTYEPGELKVNAYKDGELVCTDVRNTTGEPVGLVLKLDNSVSEANGVDVALISCYCIDSEGREVPDAAPFVSFNANSLGRVVGTGSDISDHIPVHITERRMRAGRITVAVKVGREAGELKVYAKSSGLREAVLTIPLTK
jgi:beta-galactosidase